MPDLFSPEVEFLVPDFVQIEGRLKAAYIKRFGYFEHTERITLEAFDRRTLKGVIGTAFNGKRYAFVDRKTSVSLDVDELFLISDASSLEACASCIASGTYQRLAPKPMNPAKVTDDTLVSICLETQSSWQNQFQLLEEGIDNDGNIEPGLRTPQVGAIYAALAHWSVSNKPATSC